MPKAWLSAAEAEMILALPDVVTPTGLRDRALLETLYSTGLHRLELIRLTAADLDFVGGVVSVRQGKGRKDRVIPIGERALAWVGKYLAESRPKLIRSGREEPAERFVTERPMAFAVKHLSAVVTRYLARSEVGKEGSCHLFRHPCATLMLEHGADIRQVQEQLGHACLQTTQIYTHVSIRKLKEGHAATHPGAKHSPRPKPKNDGDDALADSETRA